MKKFLKKLIHIKFSQKAKKRFSSIVNYSFYPLFSITLFLLASILVGFFEEDINSFLNTDSLTISWLILGVIFNVLATVIALLSYFLAKKKELFKRILKNKLFLFFLMLTLIISVSIGSILIYKNYFEEKKDTEQVSNNNKEKKLYEINEDEIVTNINSKRTASNIKVLIKKNDLEAFAEELHNRTVNDPNSTQSVFNQLFKDKRWYYNYIFFQSYYQNIDHYKDVESNINRWMIDSQNKEILLNSKYDSIGLTMTRWEQNKNFSKITIIFAQTGDTSQGQKKNQPSYNYQYNWNLDAPKNNQQTPTFEETNPNGMCSYNCGASAYCSPMCRRYYECISLPQGSWYRSDQCPN